MSTLERLVMRFYKNLVVFSALVLFFAVSFNIPESEAQSGSRICGWLAKKEKIAMSYEARKDDSSYSSQCDTAEKNLWDAIKKDAQLSKLSWEKTHKWTCEDVGKYVVPSGTSTDICDNMSAHCAYSIQTDPTTGKNKYTKLSCK